MRFHSSSMLVSLALATQQAALTAAQQQTTIVVGSLPSPIGWTDGVCYAPISNVRVGDALQFNFQGHNVYKMASRDDYDACNFDNAILLAEIGSTQEHTYQITEQDAFAAADTTDGSLYFACRIGAHCGSGNQKLMVEIDQSLDSPLDDMSPNPNPPLSRFISGRANCDGLTADDFLPDNSTSTSTDASDASDNGIMQSTCSDPIVEPDTGRYYSTCLSAPVPMTPGGVINQLQFLHYPYPADRRVKVGLRTWEFVADIPNGSGDVLAVPINQLYIHHLSGRVVLGQGTEGVRQSAPDAPFPEPFGLVTGDEGDSMVFHIIDLREVDDWLPCIECRCKNGNGTYLDIGSLNDFGVTVTGGVNCCTNCTSLTTPTIDYRMRYNVSFSDIEDEPVKALRMVTADMSPAVGANLEFDVPQFNNLPLDQIKEGMPNIQRLTREGPFNELFKNEFFGDDYDGPDTVRIFRCVGHLHVAAIGQWLEDAVTGEKLCENIGNYGTDPSSDKGFLNGLTVESFDTPKIIAANHPVRIVSEYDATVLHTGVMVMFFLFIDAERDVTRLEADLNVQLCEVPICDESSLPQLELIDLAALCVDELPDSPLCRFAGICSCEDLINAPSSTGCNGMYSSPQGDVPVNSLCQKSCDCPDLNAAAPAGGGGGGSGCEDNLADHPACAFGGMCDCESLVNSPESSGCGGIFENAAGDIVVNDVCGAYCDACPEQGPPDALMEEKLVEQMEDILSDTCLYATSECRNMLSALYSCGAQYAEVSGEVVATARSGEMDSAQQNVIRKHGSRLALEYAKLGHPALHVGQEEQVVLPCGEDSPLAGGKNDTTNQEGDKTPNDEDGATSAAGAVWTSFWKSLATAAFVLTVL